MDYVLNGQATGDVASTLLEHGFDTNYMRPFRGKDGRVYINVNTGQFDKKGRIIHKAVPISQMGLTANANSTLQRLEWTYLDQKVTQAAQLRLRVVKDLRAAGLQMTIPNGMGTTVLQTQAQSDFNPANISMDGIHEGDADRPVYSLENLPLPIIHKEFFFTSRQLAVSRSRNMPLDTTAAEQAAQRCAEAAEQLALGVAPSYNYGGGTVYGLTNYPGRSTVTLKNPTDSDWTPRHLVNSVLNMRTLANQQNFFGKFKLYTSLAWDGYLDNDLNALSANSSNITLRDRLEDIEGIEGVQTVDFLNGYDVVLVPVDPSQVRLIIGMEFHVVQWETHGGFRQNFKVLGIVVPQLRRDFKSHTGLVHGNVSGVTTAPTNAVYMKAYNP